MEGCFLPQLWETGVCLGYLRDLWILGFFQMCKTHTWESLTSDKAKVDSGGRILSRGWFPLFELPDWGREFTNHLGGPYVDHTGECVTFRMFAIWLVPFSSVQLLSRVRLFVTRWIAACQASLSITNFWSSLRLTSIKSVMPSSHLILCRPLFLLPPIPPSIRVFSNESTLCMRWPKYWSFSFSIWLVTGTQTIRRTGTGCSGT